MGVVKYMSLTERVPLENREFQIVDRKEKGPVYLSPVEKEDLKCAKLGDELTISGLITIRRIK